MLDGQYGFSYLMTILPKATVAFDIRKSFPHLHGVVKYIFRDVSHENKGGEWAGSLRNDDNDDTWLRATSRTPKSRDLGAPVNLNKLAGGRWAYARDN
jgi:hypothetical protein